MVNQFLKKALLSFLFVIALLYVNAQDEVEMADKLRSNGKIYVVVAVLVILFIGLFAFLISIDRKVSRLEKENKQK
ncbi:MAG: CcmD family protein [Chitinophagaceae bacterium]|nr:CcmD family protein [Chitinophagaceae bacterium]